MEFILVKLRSISTVFTVLVIVFLFSTIRASAESTESQSVKIWSFPSNVSIIESSNCESSSSNTCTIDQEIGSAEIIAKAEIVKDGRVYYFDSWLGCSSTSEESRSCIAKASDGNVVINYRETKDKVQAEIIEKEVIGPTKVSYIDPTSCTDTLTSTENGMDCNFDYIGDTNKYLSVRRFFGSRERSSWIKVLTDNTSIEYTPEDRNVDESRDEALDYSKEIIGPNTNVKIHANIFSFEDCACCCRMYPYYFSIDTYKIDEIEVVEKKYKIEVFLRFKLDHSRSVAPW